MKKAQKIHVSIDAHVGCFGNFRSHDLICKRLCILSLRCIIEQDQNLRTEIIEELTSPEAMVFRIQ
jgi:hypothetical protein